MRIFVINLKRSNRRREFMIKQLNSLGLIFELFEATDGNNLTEEDLSILCNTEKARQKIGRHLTSGEIGFTDSHLRIYEKMIAENIPRALILEDDIKLDPKIIQVLEDSFLATRKFDWLHIDYVSVGTETLRGGLKGARKDFIKNPLTIIYSLLKLLYLSITTIYEVLREKWYQHKPTIAYFARPLYLTGAYIITVEGAKKIIDLNRPIVHLADMVQNKARITSRLKLLAIVPKLAEQDQINFMSEIGEREN